MSPTRGSDVVGWGIKLSSHQPAACPVVRLRLESRCSGVLGIKAFMACTILEVLGPMTGSGIRQLLLYI